MGRREVGAKRLGRLHGRERLRCPGDLRGRCRAPRTLHPDALVQRRRLGGGLDAELVGEDVATGLVLRERGARLPARHQQQHQLAVRVLAPGVELEQAGAVIDPRRIRVLRDMGIDQHMQGMQDAVAQPLALRHRPYFEVGSAADVEAFQKIAPVQPNRLTQPGEVGRGSGPERRLERVDI